MQSTDSLLTGSAKKEKETVDKWVEDGPAMVWLGLLNQQDEHVPLIKFSYATAKVSLCSVVNTPTGTSSDSVRLIIRSNCSIN